MTERHIEEIRRGSIKAFEVLFNEYYHKVKSFAFGMLKNELEAEEVAQVVFTKVWISRDRIVSSKSLSAYIFTITRNEVVDFFRADFYYKNFKEGYLANNSQSTCEIESDIDVRQMKNMLDQAVSEMPSQRQKVFIMSRTLMMSNDEIAQSLGISKRTVEKHISMALAFLREKLGDFMVWILFFLLN